MVYTLKSLLSENNNFYSDIMKPYAQNKQSFINSLKSFKDITDDDIQTCIYYFGYEGFNDKEDAFDDLQEKILYYKKMQDPVILYRIIGVNGEDDILIDEPGEHYTPHKWNINYVMLLSIGYENWEDEIEPYVIEVSVAHSEIDIVNTIMNNLSFPNEHEITLKNKGRNVKLIKFYKLSEV